MNRAFSHLYDFGEFRLDPAERLLLRTGEPVALTPKAFDVLLVLVEHHGRLIEKDALLKTVWPDSFVEENNLADNISRLRKALGEGENGRKFIETVPRRGYRFVADVRMTGGVEPEPVAAETPRRRKTLVAALVCAALIAGLGIGYVAGIRQNRQLHASPDRHAGTWKLNHAKSTFDPNHRPSAATMVFSIDSDGHYVLTAEGIANDKKVAERPVRFIPDGKEYPLPGFEGLKTVYTRPDANTIRAEVRREDGSIAGGGLYVVSADGKSLTAETFGYDTQLRQFKQLTVWGRQ